jgi:hypothetical protein
MNKEQILQMTSKEIETFLNDNISNLSFESEDDKAVKHEMIESVKMLFDDTITISRPYYTNTELVIGINNIFIKFKVCSKKTCKTVEVSRLRKKYVKTVGKFKFDDIKIIFYKPSFEAVDLNNYIVRASSQYWTGCPSISLKHRKEKLCDMIVKNILIEEVQNQNEEWKDIRKEVILHASQPKIQQEMFNLNFNQQRFNDILQKIEEVNKSLIYNEIEKIFDIFKYNNY